MVNLRLHVLIRDIHRCDSTFWVIKTATNQVPERDGVNGVNKAVAFCSSIHLLIVFQSRSEIFSFFLDEA